MSWPSLSVSISIGWTPETSSMRASCTSALVKVLTTSPELGQEVQSDIHQSSHAGEKDTRPKNPDDSEDLHSLGHETVTPIDAFLCSFEATIEVASRIHTHDLTRT